MSEHQNQPSSHQSFVRQDLLSKGYNSVHQAQFQFSPSLSWSGRARFWASFIAWHETVVMSIIGPVLFVTAISVALNLIERYGVYTFTWVTNTHQIIGVPLGLLLVFRTNSAYDRFWEGRRQWGTIIIQSRNLMRLITSMPWYNPKEDNVADLIVAFASSVKCNLRGIIDTQQFTQNMPQTIAHDIVMNVYDLSQHLNHHIVHTNQQSNLHHRTIFALPTSASSSLITFNGKNNQSKQSLSPLPNTLPRTVNIPLLITRLISSWAGKRAKEGLLPINMQVKVEQALDGLIDAAAACDRIMRTPIPASYLFHVRQVTFLFLLSLPLILQSTYKWFSVVMTCIISFSFLGIEAAGQQIENPFGLDEGDLPLEQFIDSIAVDAYAMQCCIPDAYSLLIRSETNDKTSTVVADAPQKSVVSISRASTTPTANKSPTHNHVSSSNRLLNQRSSSYSTKNDHVTHNKNSSETISEANTVVFDFNSETSTNV